MIKLSLSTTISELKLLKLFAEDLLGYTIHSMTLTTKERSYVQQLWHGTLPFYAVLFACVFVNSVVGRALPEVESLLFVVYILGAFGVTVPLIYLAPDISARYVFTTFVNEGNWNSQTLSWFVGLGGVAYPFQGKS